MISRWRVGRFVREVNALLAEAGRPDPWPWPLVQAVARVAVEHLRGSWEAEVFERVLASEEAEGLGLAAATAFYQLALDAEDLARRGGPEA